MILMYVIMAAVILGGVAYYVLVLGPKFKAQYQAANAEFEKTWPAKAEAAIAESISNPNKYGLIQTALGEEKVLGFISAKRKEGLGKKALGELKDTITFSKTVDLGAYYLVAGDKDLHYMCFDGEKCVSHDIFEYSSIQSKELKLTQARNNDSFKMVYKGEDWAFDSHGTVDTYPRFNVHEVQGKGDFKNDFVREYLAYEPTKNMALKSSQSMMPKIMGADMFSLEAMEYKAIQEHWADGFKKKMSL